jgi:hypothetical protein
MTCQRLFSSQQADNCLALDVRRISFVTVLLSHSLLAGMVHGQSQLTIRAIDMLPNAPSTYQMRDWRTVATNFDSLAFNTTATGQFLPLVKIDNSPQSPQLQTSFGLAAYVGDPRTFGETGEPVHEAVTSLAAVLGGTLVGVDKTAGPYNWVSMTREYYVNRNSQFVVLNTPFSASGGSAWYDIYPNMLFYSIADRYPNEAYFAPILNQIDQRFYDAVGVMTANGSAPNFNYTAYNFRTRQPVYNGTWREPDMGMGMAWLQHAAYWRNQDLNPTLSNQYLTAVDWALSYYQQTSTNPDYEIMAPFGAYTAARMNAEHGRNYDIQKMVNWVFDRSGARPTKIMIGGEQWGGQDVGGLMGFTVPNTSDVRGYAFSMNTFATAMPMVPLARYEDRFSRDIGKWMLNAANAARLFYANAHSSANQSSEFWTGDPQSAIAYEGLRHHWLNGPFDGEELYAAGDPLTYDWGPQTDFALYGSAMSGVFGSIIKPTNVEKVLQLDLLATDFYRGPARDTYLYYNPYPTSVSVAIELGNDQLYDLYDAAANRFISRGVAGNNYFDITADNAVMLVKIPAGGKQTFRGRQMLVDGVVVDYNAAQLPGNLVRNADVDTASTSNPNLPGFWHGSTNAKWSTAEALSPTHSLEVTDTSSTRSEEWRSFANEIPEGTNRTLNLRWFWKADTDNEFIARLRLSNDEVLGVDLTNAIASQLFTVTGTFEDFELFEAAIPIPDGVHSFDLTFMSGSAASALGSLFIDDISASIVPTSAFFMLEGDFNGDGYVNSADLVVWQQGYGTNFTGADFLTWQRNYRPTSESTSSLQVVVPEPRAINLALLVIAVCVYDLRSLGFRVCTNQFDDPARFT